MAKTIQWGIIGCGDVAEVKSGPGFQKADHSSLVAVMRRNGKLAEDYAQHHGVPKWYDSADALIRDPDVDAVYIASSPSSSTTTIIPGHIKASASASRLDSTNTITHNRVESYQRPCWAAFTTLTPVPPT